MSEGADSIARTCDNSPTTLKTEENPEELPPRVITHTGRRPRFGTGNAPLSPYILIDGKKLRSALALRKKWPPRRVSFPTNDSHLVTGYLEPANPWKLAENVNREDLISAYKESCIRHNTDPLESVLGQLEKLNICEDERSDQLNLKGQTLDQTHSEPLEEILKRVQFNKVDLEGASLDDESSVILFDMLEYYESARHINISSNQDIGVRGWQACAHMIKKTQCLEQLEAKDVTLNEQYMNILSRALRLVCHLHVLKLENCGLSGRAIVILVTALKMNTGIRELYLADNGLDLYDAIQLGSLLRSNNHLQLLDISNNNIQDDGVRDILEGLINQVNEDKDGKGLSILILWNNRLTSKSSPFFARIITFSKTLETLNIGQNALTDELLVTIKDALKKNHILLQLGMQSTELTCDGIVTLSEIIQTNQTLERIDLRDNGIQMTGMKALSSALKKNKNITQIDLDDKPKMKIDGTLHQYVEILAEIRASCVQNEKTRSTEGRNEGSESPEHHSRICNASSRKISLTCQTLPCSSPPTAPIQNEDSARSMLEPKRASGGRLRSPAPSPIPSPVASPIPSPSRSRFVVSRVPEASLRSTDSSASSSPVTPPSLGSSPNACFFPSASGSSRFRVSVVESASGVPSPKSVVTSSKGNVTFGFNFKLDTVESTDSDDSDSVFRAELGAASERNVQDQRSGAGDLADLVPSVETREPESARGTDAPGISTNRCLAQEPVKLRSQDSVRYSTSQDGDYCCDVRDNQRKVPTELETLPEVVESNRNESTKDIQTRVNINEDNTDSSCPVVTNKLTSANYERDPTKEPATATLNERTEPEPQTKQNSSVQKHTSSLEKLLALFQNPGSFFSDSGSIGNQLETKSTFQESVNSVMAFGDKFHSYLKEGKEKVNIHGAYPWTSDESAKSKPAKSANITQLSSFQTLTNMFSSFKLDANLNLFEQTGKSCPKPAENTALTRENGKDGAGSQDVQCTIVRNSENRKFNIYINDKDEEKEKTRRVSASSNQSLPDDVQSKANEGHANKDLVVLEEIRVVPTVEACSKIVNTSPTTIVPESKATVCIPKLVDIPEYSVLEIKEPNVKLDEGEELIDKVDSMLVETTCDRTSTDSINPTSDSNAPSCNITCDIKRLNDVHNVDTVDNARLHNLISTNLTTEDAIGEKRSNATTSFVSDQNLNVNNNVSAVQHDEEKFRSTDRHSSHQVTNTHSTPNNENVDPTSQQNNTRKHLQNTDNTCHVDNLSHLNSTIVSRTSEKRLEDVSVTPKDDTEFTQENSLGSTSADEESPRNASQPEELIKLDNDDSCIQSVEFDTTRDGETQEVHRTTKVEVHEEPTGGPFPEGNAEKSRDSGVIPTVILSYHESSEEVCNEKDCPEYEKSDADDLIFCITDISTDVVPAEEESGPGLGNWTTETSKVVLYDLPQTSRSSLLLEKPESPHRNSHDSGIEEANLSTAEDPIQDAMHVHAKESFQESVDSGIDSECSSVCVKAEPGLDGGKVLVRKSTSDSGGESASEAAQEDFEPRIVPRGSCSAVQCTDPDAEPTFRTTVNCALVSSSGCSVPVAEADDQPGASAVAAESSATVQGSSPK